MSKLLHAGCNKYGDTAEMGIMKLICDGLILSHLVVATLIVEPPIRGGANSMTPYQRGVGPIKIGYDSMTPVSEGIWVP